MAFIIIIIVSSIAALVMLHKWAEETFDSNPYMNMLDKSWAIIWRFLVMAILWFLTIVFVIGGILIPAANSSTKDIREVETKTTGIKSLGNGAKQSGEFYITWGVGQGGSETKKIINYVRVNEDGTYSLTEADAESSVIREVDNEKNPRVVVTTKQKFATWLDKDGLDKFETYEFVVPKGTVGSDISIDVNK